MPRPLSRRQALALGAGGAVIAAVGGGAIVSASLDKTDLARAVLVRLVGPFRMTPADFTAFVDAFDATPGFPAGLKGDVLTLAQTLMHGRDVASLLPGQASAWFETFERDLLTRFVMSTDLVRGRATPDDDVHYLGLSPACSSPFARFES